MFVEWFLLRLFRLSILPEPVPIRNLLKVGFWVVGIWVVGFFARRIKALAAIVAMINSAVIVASFKFFTNSFYGGLGFLETRISL